MERKPASLFGSINPEEVCEGGGLLLEFFGVNVRVSSTIALSSR